MDPSTPSAGRKLTRASKPKARTGCLTCKLRHVKCDEQKPQCLRCTSLGRRCGGYKHLTRSNTASRDESGTPERTTASTSLTIVRPLAVFVASSSDEKRAVEFFHHKAAPQLSGYFHSRFWSELVLQVAVDEPAVRHAMIALSSIYEGDVYAKAGSPDAALKRQDFGLESYNRAIRLLISDMSSGQSVRVPLITCVIFVCVDCLRRDIPVALKHIEGGMKLLEIWRKKHHDPTRRNELLRSVDFEVVEEQLLPMFAWLNMATAIFGRPSFSVASLSADSVRAVESTKRPFRSIHDAISSFLDLIDPAIKLIQANVQSKYVGLGPEPVAEQARLLGLMDDWHLSFEHLMHNERTKSTDHLTNGYNVMLACTMSVRVWLEACLSPHETVWDNYKSQFEEMVQLAKPVIFDHRRFPDEFSRSFSFELGMIPTLQFVAWKCRWPRIRRKALQLLRSAPRRECVFDSSYAYALYERVRILEESALDLEKGQAPAEDQLPPEHSRIHVIDLPPLAPTTSGRAVNFLTRPNGADQGWNVRSEFLQLNGLELLNRNEENTDPPIDHLETSTTGLWSSNVNKARESGNAGVGTEICVPLSAQANGLGESSLPDEGYLQLETPSFTCRSLGPVIRETSTAVFQGADAVLTGARLNHYSPIQIPVSEPKSVG